MIKLYSTKCHARTNTNEAHKPSYELVISFLWQWCPLDFTATSIWNHSWKCIWRSVPPCSKASCNINFNIKWFHQNKGCGTTPAESHIRNVNKGWKHRGGGFMSPDHPRNRCKFFPFLSTTKFFATNSKTYWNPVTNDYNHTKQK